MVSKNQIKKTWKYTNKTIKYLLLIVIFFLIYSFLILILIPERYFRSGYYLPGLSGWEFGLWFLILYLLISSIFLEPPISKEQLSAKPAKINFSFKTLIFLNIFIFLAMYFLLFATQLLENLIGVYRCQSRTADVCNKDGSGWLIIYNLFDSLGIDHSLILYLIWTFSGVFFFGCFLFFGIAVDYAKRKGIFEPSGLNAFNYIFWVNVLLGSTGWMYIAWFSLTDFDIKMWSALAKGETWGYFSLGIVGVFFNSVPELIFMIGVSCSLFFLNFITLKKYLKRIIKEKT